ncbi:Protein kinase domain [Dillenia turbinata]|uniref:mitogen-activated protein kinase kinase kinase n=1 Tax=Dillenia turbinata TaxID=194707 RepID=A0AAN8W0U8_9MAGN
MAIPAANSYSSLKPKPRIDKSKWAAIPTPSSPDSTGPRWIRGSFIGKGTYGSVFVAKVMNPTNEFLAEVAAKTAEISRSPTLKYEKHLLNMFEHEKVIQSYNLLLELCAESLRPYIQRSCGGLAEVEIRGITGDIVNGIACIHSQDYVHGDIKPANILLVSKPFPREGSGGCSHDARI